MSAAKLDILIEQGATWQKEFTFLDSEGTAVDVTGWTFRGQIRETYDSSDIVASFSFSAGSATNKKIATLSDTVTAAIEVIPSSSKPIRTITTYIYDIEAIVDSGNVERIFQGAANVSAEVTR